jgi:hypothetical protein
MPRDYPPAVVIHSAGCREVAPVPIIGRQRPAAPLRQVAADYPNGIPHDCVNPHMPDVPAVATDPGWPAHEYASSGAYRQPDAARPLCDHCRGTHGQATSPLHVTR